MQKMQIGGALGVYAGRLFMGKQQRPAARTTRPVEGRRRVGRNEPCPCGSGVKYKKCCGR